MYQLLGDIVVDVDEFIETLEQAGITVTENITRATKREDAVGLRIKASLAEIGIEGSIEDADRMEECMVQIQKEYEQKLQGLLDESFSFALYAYTYDEVENAVLLNFAMMDRFIARKKLRDVAKRLFDV